MNGRENYLKLLRGEMPERFPAPNDMRMIFSPGEHNMDGLAVGPDWFGCSWTEVGKSAIQGATITPGTRRLDDITRWKEEGVIPTREQIRAFDWAGYAAEVLEGFDRENQILLCRSLVGPFGRLHCLMGFEDALCAFYEEPEAVEEFFRAMLEYKKNITDCVVEYLDPDILCYDDDYGTSNSTFLSPDMWREFMPPFWRELVGYVHEKGKYFELHSCGFITPLVGDFAALGMDILQPIQDNNDLEAIKSGYGHKLILRQAIFNKEFGVLGQTEDEVRRDIRRMLRILAPGGRFIPELVPIDDRYYEILGEEVEKFGAEFFQ